MYQFRPPLVRFWPPCSEWHNSQYNRIKLVKIAYFYRLTWMLSKYQDENVETQRLEINNNENGHNRYSDYNWCIYPTGEFIMRKRSTRDGVDAADGLAATLQGGRVNHVVWDLSVKNHRNRDHYCTETAPNHRINRGRSHCEISCRQGKGTLLYSANNQEHQKLMYQPRELSYEFNKSPD